MYELNFVARSRRNPVLPGSSLLCARSGLRVPGFPARLHPAVLLSCLSALVLFTGCGNSMPGNSGGSTSMPTVTITANPASITSGGSSTLTVAATNATQVTVIGGGSTYTLQSSGGTQSVTPTATTTYTATAVGAGGTVTATATVTVSSAVPVPTIVLLANPTSVPSGGSSTLTVTATDATQVTLSGGGNTYTLQPTGGTQSVTPTATTIYTATATGAGGTVTATATVTVVPPVTPTVTISANPTSVTSGNASTLTVTATNATQVKVTGGGNTYTLQPSGGTPSVTPSATTVYTATATGPGGTVTATVTVRVQPNPAPTVTITANPTSVISGSSSILTVTATNATQVTLKGSDNTSYPIQPSGGTQSVSPTRNTTYTATATGAGGTVSATVTITVTPNPPPTVTLIADPSSIVSGGTSTLTVASTYANQVTITGTDGSTYTLPSTNGTQGVTPTATTTYTATANGVGGTATATATVTLSSNPPPAVTIVANPTTIATGNSSLLTVTATNASAVTVTGSNGGSYTLQPNGGTQSVSPTANTTYTATATGGGLNVTATAAVTVVPAGTVNNIDHVVFLMQENHTFDNYFGMLNPYRQSNSSNGQAWNVGDDGNTYTVDGIDDKLSTTNKDDEGDLYSLFKFTSTCVDDLSSDWIASYGDVNTYNFAATRPILMGGFVHTAEGYAKYCTAASSCSGSFTDMTGQRAMGYYDQGFLNYYYYMASQFALSDRWFSPDASKSISNRIATFTGGTTQGLVKDPGSNDHLNQLAIPTVFQELDQAHVSWKIYYTVTQGYCLAEDDCPTGSSAYPATDFSYLSYSTNYMRENKTGAPCPAPMQSSSVVGDATNSFCIDPKHVAPIGDATYGYYADLANGTLPSFAFIEAGFGRNDEHPGSGQSVLSGQTQVAKVVNALMGSPEWKDSVFFLSYDEGGGPYEHVPPVPGHTNDYTDASQVPNYPIDISSISVNPDSYNPCLAPGGVPALHCDLASTDPGAVSTDAPAQQGFAAQLGFRLPNIVISPFTRRHYVSHVPMDHTAVLKFVEDRFIGPSAHLTNRDAAQPNLLDFFNFNAAPWATPPTPPTPFSSTSTCHPASMGP